MGLFSAIKIVVGVRDDRNNPSAPGPASSLTTSSRRPDPAVMDLINPNVGGAAVAALVRTRVLFVVGAATAQAELEKTLRPLRSRWQLSMAVRGDDATSLLAGDPFSVIVADADLDGVSGVNFLTETAKSSPTSVRFLRCGPRDREALKSHTRPTIYTLGRDADADTIEGSIERALLVDEWMTNPGIGSLVRRMKQMPSLPTLYTQVVTELQKPDASIEFVARLIATDPLMAAKILQVVNSPFFGLTSEITEPAAAVMFLGTERTKSLVLLAKVFSQFDRIRCTGFSQENLWRHSMAVGAFARSIMLAETRNTRLADMAFTAGLLHDVGKLLLAANLADEYSVLLAQTGRRQLPIRDVEQESLGATHSELGACLLGLWNLPLPILHAVAWHHVPANGPDRAFSILSAVHIANALDYERRASADGSPVSVMDSGYLDQLGLVERTHAWRQVCGCPPKADKSAEARRLHTQAR